MTTHVAASVLAARVKRVGAMSIQEIDAAIRAIEECRIIVAKLGDIDAELFAFQMALHKRADALTKDRAVLHRRLRLSLAKVNKLIEEKTI